MHLGAKKESPRSKLTIRQKKSTDLIPIIDLTNTTISVAYYR